jgi:hypothetical protein
MSTEPTVLHYLAGDLPVPEYEGWLASRPEAMIYAATMFHRFLAAAVGGECHYLLARRGGATCGVLPFFRRDVNGVGCVINSLPWYGTHGGCIGVEPGDAATRAALLRAFAGYASEARPLSSTLVLSPEESLFAGEYLAGLEHVVTDSRIGQVTPLPEGGGSTALAATLLQKTRNLVNKSLRQGFREEPGDDSDAAWQFLCDVHTENLEAIGGKAKPRSHFEALRAEIPPAHRRLSVAWLGDEPVAALLLLAFNETVEYLTPVIRAEHRSRQPLSFLIWHGMHWAMARGCRSWNWGGTWVTQTSLLHFKAGWGAIQRPYFYVVTAAPQMVGQLRLSISDLSAAFPFYYVYPFAKL